MKRKLRKGLSFLVACLFVGSALMLLVRLYDDQRSARANEAAQELVQLADQPTEETPASIPEEAVPLQESPDVQPEDSEPVEPVEEQPPEESPVRWEPLSEDALFLMDLDLEALRQTSENVLGWIHIPNSAIDYPLMSFEDNETGLHQAWDGTKNSAGCIFLECKNSPDFSDFNTILYGHNMRAGTMFGTLKAYAQSDYLSTHKLIYIVSDDCVRRYEVFSAYEAAITSDTYRLYFADDETKRIALDHYIGSAGTEAGILPVESDYILTLSTCMGNGTYDTRWVVQAVLTGEFSR